MNERVVVPIIAPVLEAHGLELDHLDIIPAGRRKVLRITVDGDGPKGRGPLLDDIARATRDISDALDASPQIGEQPYTLEVSSRGIGKPLEQPKHYRRNIGRLVLVQLADGEALRGRLTDADDQGITVTIEPEAGKRLPKDLDPVNTVAYGEITKTTVQVEMNRKPDPELDEIGEPGDDEDDDEGDDLDVDDEQEN